MSDDSEEFDPSAAAARATGDLVDAGADDLEDAPAPDPDDGADPSDDGDDADAESSNSSEGAVATFVVPLFTAEEAGPTADTLQEEAGLGERVAHAMDGVLDYALHFSDRWRDRLEDSLGPAGKFGRAVSGLGADTEDVDDTQSGHQEHRDDDGDDVEPSPSAAATGVDAV